MEYIYKKYRIIKKKIKTSWGWGFDGPTLDIYHIQGIIESDLNFLENKLVKTILPNFLYNYLYNWAWTTICCEDLNCHNRVNGTGYFTELSQAVEYFHRAIKPELLPYVNASVNEIFYNELGNEIDSYQELNK